MMNPIRTCKSFSELDRMTQTIKPGISFWGWRYVTLEFQHKKFKVSIGLIYDQLDRILRFDPNFSREERVHLRNLENRIKIVYKHMTKLYEKSRCITQLFCRVRGWFYRQMSAKPYPVNEMENGTASEFYYSDAQFKAEYGISIENARRWCDGFQRRGGTRTEGWRINPNWVGIARNPVQINYRFERPAIMLRPI